MTVTLSLSPAQSSSAQGGTCSVLKKERGVRVVDFGVVKWLFLGQDVKPGTKRVSILEPVRTLLHGQLDPITTVRRKSKHVVEFLVEK